MENRKCIGSQRTAAAILLLWGFLYQITEMVVVNGMKIGRISMNAFSWVSLLCTLGMVVLLFIGKRNIGFLICMGLQTLIAIRHAIVFFGVYRVVWLAADVLMLLVMIFATIPSLYHRKNPFRNLEFIPAALYLLPYLFSLFSRGGHYGPMYYVNGIIGALAWWFMGRALTAVGGQESVKAAADNSYKTYVQPAAQAQARPVQPAPSPAPPQDGPGVLLVRFSIDELNKLSGSYGFQSGRLIAEAVPPSLLEGMTISDGDSAATLNGREYVCIVSIATSSKRSVLKEKIEPLILASKEIKACGVSPLTQIVSSTREPLVMDGIVRNGSIEGSGGWCANGFTYAWKERNGGE